MSKITIFEVLQNARFNLCRTQTTPLQNELGKSQLRNAMVLLEKDFSLYDEFDESKLDE